MQITTRQIDELKPYAKNARQHPKKQIELLASNIERFGFTTPVLIDNNNEVIAGHGRLLAMRQLGKTEVPCVLMGDLTKDEVKALRLADNQIAAMGDIDMSLVIEELKELNIQGFDIEITGFDTDLLIEHDEKDDVIPENVETRVKTGDIWQLGSHRLMCGDSTIREDVENLMDGNKADMVFTDPPYGVNYLSRMDKERRKPWGEIANDDLSGTELVSFLRDSVGIFPQPKYVCCNWQSVKDFFEALGMPSSLIVWDKKSVGLGANYRSQHEFILFYGKLNHRSETNVWSLKRDAISEYAHPTQKPVELIVRAIVNSSEQDEIVVDLFLGSGSTIIAAEKTGRLCYGMELSEKYCDVIITRWEQFTGKQAERIHGTT